MSRAMLDRWCAVERDFTALLEFLDWYRSKVSEPSVPTDSDVLEYLGIDEAQLERERRAVLAEQRVANAKAEGLR